MEPNKRHKRSGSTSKAAVSHSAAAPRFTKRYTVPRPFGKFQSQKGRVEKKNLDTDIVAAGLSTLPSLATATVYCLNLFNAGNTATTVTGRHCVMRSLLLRMSIREPGNTTVNNTVPPTAVRVLVVYDRQPSGALGTVAQILGSTTFGTASPINLAFSDRFSVLVDEKLTVGGSYQTTSLSSLNYHPGQYVDRYVKVGLPCEAGNTGAFSGTIAGLATGAILLLAWSDVAAANNPPVVDAAMSRVRYVDN